MTSSPKEPAGTPNPPRLPPELLIRSLVEEERARRSRERPGRALLLSTLLLVVVALGGALLLQAGPMRDARDRAQETAARRALQGLLEAQDQWHDLHGRYAASAEAMRASGLYRPPDGVRVEILSADEEGFRARAARGGGIACTMAADVQEERTDCRRVP
jgi:hypothetical protein